MSDMRVTVLVENTVYRRGLRAEHGLAFWIETNSKKILFDTGQSNLLLRNAQALGIDVSHASAIVLSHGHYDHVGGLSHVLDLARKAQVYLHPAALKSKFSFGDGRIREIGINAALRKKLQEKLEAGQVTYTQETTSVCDGLIVTGEIPRISDFEDTGGRFFADSRCSKPDMLPDDQALFWDSPQGLVVLLGCAHAGVVNTLEHIGRIAPGRTIRGIMGGMHLVHANGAHIGKIIELFQRLGITRIGPCHCTGWQATRQLWNHFTDGCFHCSVGTQVGF